MAAAGILSWGIAATCRAGVSAATGAFHARRYWRGLPLMRRVTSRTFCRRRSTPGRSGSWRKAGSRLPAVEEDRPRLDRLDGEHAVPVPAVLRKALSHHLLRGCVDRMQDLALASERSPKNDEPLLEQRVHESRVLIPAVLLAQIVRPIPGTATLEPNGEEHAATLRPAPGSRLDYSNSPRGPI